MRRTLRRNRCAASATSPPLSAAPSRSSRKLAAMDSTRWPRVSAKTPAACSAFPTEGFSLAELSAERLSSEQERVQQRGHDCERDADDDARPRHVGGAPFLTARNQGGEGKKGCLLDEFPVSIAQFAKLAGILMLSARNPKHRKRAEENQISKLPFISMCA